MHELSIAEALIKQVREELDRRGQTGRVVRLELAVGRLSGIHCDSLRFAFERLAPNTPLEGAEMHITEPKPVCHCRHCGTRVDIEELVAECPQCSSREIAIEGGRELLLQSIELED